jgi:hypothetical protein
LQRSPDRRFAAFVFARQVGHRLAISVALGNAAALSDIEHSLATELLALGLGAIDAFLTAGADQAALKFSDARP